MNMLVLNAERVEPPPWGTRIRIAMDAAKGLDFLHTSENTVIYRDFKTANILLDENFGAKLPDFGLARIGASKGISHVSTQAMGTYGYAAPEYIATGHLYVKSDVYGFGGGAPGNVDRAKGIGHEPTNCAAQFGRLVQTYSPRPRQG